MSFKNPGELAAPSVLNRASPRVSARRGGGDGDGVKGEGGVGVEEVVPLTENRRSMPHRSWATTDSPPARARSSCAE